MTDRTDDDFTLGPGLRQGRKLPGGKKLLYPFSCYARTFLFREHYNPAIEVSCGPSFLLGITHKLAGRGTPEQATSYLANPLQQTHTLVKDRSYHEGVY